MSDVPPLSVRVFIDNMLPNAKRMRLKAILRDCGAFYAIRLIFAFTVAVIDSLGWADLMPVGESFMFPPGLIL